MKEITSTDTTLPLESIVGRLEGGETASAYFLNLPGEILVHFYFWFKFDVYFQVFVHIFPVAFCHRKLARDFF